MSAYRPLEKIESIRFLKDYNNNKKLVLEAQRTVTAENHLCSFGKKCKSHEGTFDCKYNHDMPYEAYVEKVAAKLESAESEESAESAESVVTGSVETNPVPPVQPPNCLVPYTSTTVSYVDGPDGKYKQTVTCTWTKVQ
jgi:hypothetical protein